MAWQPGGVSRIRNRDNRPGTKAYSQRQKEELGRYSCRIRERQRVLPLLSGYMHRRGPLEITHYTCWVRYQKLRASIPKMTEESWRKFMVSSNTSPTSKPWVAHRPSPSQPLSPIDTTTPVAKMNLGMILSRLRRSPCLLPVYVDFKLVQQLWQVQPESLFFPEPPQAESYVGHTYQNSG